MKVIIAGSRSITDYRTVEQAIDAAQFEITVEITEVVSGGASGVDKLGELWASENNCEMTRFPAYWNEYGKAAGPMRNEQMAKYADALIAIWDGKSKGTEDMIRKAKKHSLKVYIYFIKSTVG